MLNFFLSLLLLADAPTPAAQAFAAQDTPPPLVLPKAVTMNRQARILDWAEAIEQFGKHPIPSPDFEDAYVAGLDGASSVAASERTAPPRARARTPLEAAIRTGDIGQVVTALSAGEQPSGAAIELPHASTMGSGSALHLAAALGLSSAVELLLWGVACHGQGAAGAAGEKKQVRAVLESQSTMGFTPLLVAAGSGHTAVVALLLRRGADIEARTDDKRTALMLAAYCGYTEMAALLLDQGASTKPHNDYGCTALILACYTGHTTTAALCLDAGANIEFKHVNGSTALLLAAQNGHTDTVAWLLRRGAEVEARSNKKHTALTLAARNGHTSTALMLLNKGADGTAANVKGCTALISAARQGHVDMCRALLAHGLGIEDKDHSGWVPLHYAAYGGHPEVVAVLLKAGADPLAESTMGDLPLDVAELKGQTDVAALLTAGMVRSSPRAPRDTRPADGGRGRGAAGPKVPKREGREREGREREGREHKGSEHKGREHKGSGSPRGILRVGLQGEKQHVVPARADVPTLPSYTLTAAGAAKHEAVAAGEPPPGYSEV